jgi:hypothetical protein
MFSTVLKGSVGSSSNITPARFTASMRTEQIHTEPIIMNGWELAGLLFLFVSFGWWTMRKLGDRRNKHQSYDQTQHVERRSIWVRNHAEDFGLPADSRVKHRRSCPNALPLGADHLATRGFEPDSLRDSPPSAAKD